MTTTKGQRSSLCTIVIIALLVQSSREIGLVRDVRNSPVNIEPYTDQSRKALLLASSVTKEADVVWLSKADQIRMALLVEKKVNLLLFRITDKLEISYF
jgi:hypothetical protein